MQRCVVRQKIELNWKLFKGSLAHACAERIPDMSCMFCSASHFWLPKVVMRCVSRLCISSTEGIRYSPPFTSSNNRNAKSYISKASHKPTIHFTVRTVGTSSVWANNEWSSILGHPIHNLKWAHPATGSCENELQSLFKHGYRSGSAIRLELRLVKPRSSKHKRVGALKTCHHQKYQRCPTSHQPL